jgi:cation transport protein ChaC
MKKLTRDAILSGELAESLRAADPTLPILTDAELQRSRNAFLSGHNGGSLWVFAYGSLIWNPTFRFVERRPARLFGYHRSFCLRTSVGRGTAERPGLMLGLEAGGSCNGVIFRIAASAVDEETWVLWKREMIVGSYVPRWGTVRDPTGKRRAVAFVINKAHPMFASDLPRSEVVRMLSTAEGNFGSSSDYLFRTVARLEALGIRDPGLAAIARDVKAARQAGCAG